MKVVEVTGSKLIQESFHFGFTKCENTSKLENKLKGVDVEGCKFVSVDMAFGYIVFALPSPSIDLSQYQKARTALISAVKIIVEESENV